ncbi:ShlB/FhaC/HecB family hemolysin secretion/activation protein [Sphingosinicella rhizophila]|uniref:ShlB/FhaC/HecB family hemolysin secretion/activation protein n=1 Tax=Sphingosinicella rhizophila TaxID=3050082 RepID=A0ABU3QAE4_9SPHN|nr:ShlB/FhaC/HecB family hemolysin secretion/activation protein [Sphingosinicella sp. GR2756]MDT9600369.1 ShlB/FhaC/HecB family hemolysin secretion/activation protein [Sphingosinicella sp. GR2756]
MPTSSVFAQVVPPPGSVPPTRGEIEAQTAPAKVPPASQLRVEGGIERAPCALAGPEYADIRFTPTEVTFEDLKGLTPAEMRAAYAPFLGAEQPIASVCEIRDRAATILRDAGYIASVEVPEQRIADGRLRFHVLMAKLVALRVRGDAGRAERKIASYLEPLTGQEVFNRFKAERALLLASDLPGYSVRLALRSAGAARGEVIGEVTVTHIPFLADASIQNLGSRELGRWGAVVRGQLYGLTGMGDRTYLSLYSMLDTSEQKTLQIGHDFRPGGDGLTIGASFTYSWTNPDLDLPNAEVEGRTLFANVEASYPLLRSQATNVRAAIGFDFADQDVELIVPNGAFDLSRDRLRVGYLRLTADTAQTRFSDRRYNIFEPRWRMGGFAELRKGLDMFGASPDCRADPLRCSTGGHVPPSRLGNPTATVLRTQVQGEFRPVPRVTLAGSARGQYSASPLLSFEEFSGGNYTVGRGYDPGTITGHSGVGLQGEIRFGSLFPSKRDGLAIEPFLFVDHAIVWNEDRFGAALPRLDLTSMGGGIRAAFGDRLRLDVSLAAPLDRILPGNRRPDPRLLVSLSTRLWPWSFR